MINIIIADDHEIVRDGLAHLLEKDKNIKVVAQAKDGMEAVSLCREHKPDIIIMDIGMPLLNGLDAAEQILTKIGSRVIILSMYTEDKLIMRAVKMGVSGFLLKNGTSKELIDAIKTVSNGKTYLTPDISSRVIENISGKHPDLGADLDVLTQKEKHILQLISEGHSTKEIARLLKISFHTAKTHRNHIMQKLNLHSVAALTNFAVTNKLSQ